MQPLSEKQLDKIFADALRDSEEFRAWVLSRTKFGNRDAEVVIIRSDHPWSRSRLTGRDSETDILLVLRDRLTAETFALHFENKRANGSFTPLQPETYQERARQWLGLPKFGAYTDFECVLIAPRAFHSANHDKAEIFDRYIAYEDIAKILPGFGSSLT